VVNVKGVVFWDVMPCILKMEAAGCSKILVSVYSQLHFVISQMTNLYKSVSEILRVMRSFYSRNILMQNTEIFNSYDGG